MDKTRDCGSRAIGSIPIGDTMEGSHSGLLHEFRKLEGVIPSQVQILHPPHHFLIIKIIFFKQIL